MGGPDGRFVRRSHANTPPRATAANQNRAATIAAEGRSTLRTMSGTVPHIVVVAANANDAC